ncbi:hypothetical protein EJ05DRAFT_25774 [Pseudovirgaria hyperparasitica]|uniref:Zn(2)-C6 fungal-type domain-containing protein n=1 Tax=Pseudovirgaria hyperparasitica TaxID=470096 RepID=A0A6A6WLR8_9PEZI|nr:uncharacterized protein EJ05DRAFT_25774 [Pseudovirgaria hyperparasitica]KAF2763098.1 hypothetical protein EJ05DRAFT_25774 [Pseudovirgaria hyperparasitica]
MTKFSDLTSRFRVAVPNHDRTRVSKRNRLAVSCSNCRTRRTKCDRKQPCDSCTKRSMDSSCSFTPTTPRDKHEATRAVSRKSEAARRLQELECIVSKLIQPRSEPPDDDANNTSSSGSSHISSTPVSEAHLMAGQQGSGAGGDIGYAGSTNWRSVLESIQGIRAFLDVNDGGLSEGTPAVSLSDIQEPASDFTASPASSRIVDELPDRPTVDTLLMTYFNARFVTVSFIHANQFHREYDAFWENPSSTPHLWISLLCSMLCLGSVVALARKDPIATLLDKTAPAIYADKAWKYLVSGQYLKQKSYAVEALLIHSYSKYWFTTDQDSDIWTNLGLVTRLAQNMGYHRDPRWLGSNLSPFQGEMRRRTWNFIEVFDLLASLQLGMPPVIHEGEFDAEPPSNLHDDDFDELSATLPPSRSSSDCTYVAYMICKARISAVFRKILRVVLMSDLERLVQVVESLNMELDQVHESFPQRFRIRPIKSSSFTDQPFMIVQRLLLELLYLKAKCVLHRDFLSLPDEYLEYKGRARNAALRVLELQYEYHNESQLGGRLEREDWVLTGLIQHDFLLAAM